MKAGLDPVKLAAAVRRRETSPWVSLYGGVLTGTILVAGGVWLISYTLREGAGDGTPIDTATGLIVALFIAVAGVGVMVFGFRTGSRAREVTRRRKEHPDEAWRWRPEWDDATLESTNRTKMLVAWGVTVLMLLFTLPFGLQAVDEIRGGNAAAWVAFAFPLLVLGMLVHAIRATARYRRYGTTELLLAPFPLAPGTAFSGTIRTAVPAEFHGGLEARLRCVKAWWGGSEKRQRKEMVVFQEERAVAWNDIRREGDAMTFSIAFRLPPDAPESGESGDEPWHEWTLTLHAGVPGADYHATFEVPVVGARVPEGVAVEIPGGGAAPAVADAALEEDAGAGTADPGQTALERPDPGRVRIDGAGDGLRLFYPVGSRRSEALVLLKIGTVGVGVGIAVYAAEAPAPIWGVFAGIGALAVGIGICLWLQVREVRVTPRAIETGGGLVRPWGRTRIAAERIERIHLGEASRSGDVVYWKAVARTKSGAKLTLGTGMKDWSEAAWIADRVARTIGVPFDRSVS